MITSLKKLIPTLFFNKVVLGTHEQEISRNRDAVISERQDQYYTASGAQDNM